MSMYVQMDSEGKAVVASLDRDGNAFINVGGSALVLKVNAKTARRMSMDILRLLDAREDEGLLTELAGLPKTQLGDRVRVVKLWASCNTYDIDDEAIVTKVRDTNDAGCYVNWVKNKRDLNEVGSRVSYLSRDEYEIIERAKA